MGKRIGLKIKERREELGLTQMELAEKMGYKSKAAICKVECGKDNITFDRVIKFAEALDCPITFLMDSNEDLHEELRRKQNEAINQTLMELAKDEMNVISNEEREFLRSFRHLDDEAQRQIVLMMAFFKEQGKTK